MASRVIRSEEAAALIVVLAAHAALVWWLTVYKPATGEMPLPETITVTLSDEVGLTSTSPEPAAEPAPATAPEFGEAPPPPEPPKAQPSPKPKPLVQQPQARPTPNARATPPPKQTGKPGGSKLGQDFLNGVPAAQSTGASPYLPANLIGAAVRASLASAIARELKPRWVAPQGAEAEKLVTILTWDLNPDGTLSGSPRLVRQEGITEANRAQAQRHVEQAIRAVRLAAPFDLPEQYYNAWKRITTFRFDRKLSQ